MDTENISVEFKTKTPLSKKLIPLILAFAVILLDQITKCLIVHYLPHANNLPYTIGPSFFGDFLRIIHVCNPGIAFSIGTSWSLTLRAVLFRVFPLFVLVLVLIVYFRNDEFTQFQRWAITGIVGGGFGNLIDRYFRADGVVDFIDIKFYGIFGMDRWPTFNVADAAVVVCGILLIISFLIPVKKNKQRS